MKTTLPEPLSLPRELKPVSSARSGLKTLADGRRCFWVDEFLKGITPKMVVWFPLCVWSTTGGVIWPRRVCACLYQRPI